MTAILPTVMLLKVSFPFAQVSGDEADPAGGAEIGEIIIATAGAAVVTALALLIVIGHRSGRLAWPGRLAAYSERVSGVPGWASLPIAVVGGSLLIAVVGMYWDISLHIDNGRDPGPLANPAHYFILAGLFGIFIAGLLSMALPDRAPVADRGQDHRLAGTRRSAAC